MAKRSPSSDGDDSNSTDDDLKASSTKRQRLVEFEPVRLVNIQGVSDIENRVDKFKLHKIAERLRTKQRQLDEEKRKVDRLTARQDNDDNTLCTLNRHWNRLDEDIRLILARTTKDDDLGDDQGPESSADFLAKIAEYEDDECERVYDARVQHTLKLASRLSDIEVTRSEQFNALCRKLNKFMQSGEKSDETICELTSKCSLLAEENRNLSRSTHKMQLEHREMALKLKDKEDQIAILKTKREELKTQLDEKDFELQKSWRREEKLDTRLADLAREMKSEHKTKKETVETSNGVHVDIPADKLEEMQRELDFTKETSAARLQELTELNERNSELVGELEKIRTDLKTIPSDVIRSSEEFVNLQAFYTIMVDEVQRMKEEKEVVLQEMEELKKSYEDQITAMEHEEQLSQSRLAENQADVEAQLNQVRKEYEMLRIEFEQTLAANEMQGPTSFDYRTTITTLNNQIQMMRSESNKFKAKWKMAVGSLATAQRELDAERKKYLKYLMIPLDDKEIKKYEEKFSKELNKKNGGDEKKEEQEEVEAIDDETESSDENVLLQRKIKRLEKDRDRAVTTLAIHIREESKRSVIWGPDADRRIKSLEKQLDQLKQELGHKCAEEEGLLAEMESTGQAFEEMQEENSKLLVRIKEAEEQHLKVMSDRIYMNQTHHKLKEEKSALEEQKVALTNTVHANNHTLSSVREQLEVHKERIKTLSDEMNRLQQVHEQLRRLQLQESKKAHELKVLVEKNSTQLQEAQQAMKSKLSGHEKDEFRIRRLEEEKSILKKRLERAKKSELVGSADAVLLEEIKELKDVLTCPSCKVRRKDGILTKCFHVFCMDCLKTRYETRRRKCPKCNAAFGANDFHRVYIG